ncbi:MAG: dehydrogenase maturation factor [Solirubrobacteraceae bacterium]|nr:dehydrogenase maturation factor [Solirubrobacteraceae bacterium]
MKIVVAGKGGVGKTTVSGTISRAFARAGHDVLALDADTNPMLGVSLGVGPEQTDLLVAVRQGLETGETEHERSTDGFVARFGRDAPDGVRLVVASRIERPNPGCMCCGVSPEGLLNELESEGKIIVGDLEAGIGTVMRLQEGQADIVLIVAQPTAKSLDIARRAVELASDRGARMIVVANRVRDDEDLAVIRAAVGDCEMVVVPDDPAIAQADREGRAAIDVDPDSPGVRALVELAERLAGIAVAA